MEPAQFEDPWLSALECFKNETLNFIRPRQKEQYFQNTQLTRNQTFYTS